MAGAAALLLIALAAGCSDGSGDTAEPAPRAGGPEVDVVLTSGARLGASAPAQPVLVLGDALVALGQGAVEPGHADPLVRSTDGGRTWSPPVTPEDDPGDPSLWGIHAIDGLALLASGGEHHNGDAPPTIWVSHDDGATFSVAAGVGDGVSGGGVRSVVGVDGHLLGLGAVRATPGGPFLPATWISTDRGLTWTRSEHPELALAGWFSPSVVVSGGAVLVKADRALVRSADGGRTWDLVAFPGADDEATIVGLEAAGDVVLATGLVPGAPTFNGEWAATYLTTDAGTTWRPAERLPPVPDRNGSGTVLGPLGSVQTVDGDLIARASTNANNEYSVSYLLRSADGGSTWSVADPGVTCRGEEAPAGLGPVAVTGDLAVATYGCSDGRPARLLASTDGGRTWDEVRDERFADRQLGTPFPSGEGRISLLAGRGAVVHVALPR